MLRRVRTATVMAALLLLALGAIGLSRAGCEAVGFKWASVPSRCVTPLCSVFHACGKWAFPSARCDRVKVGAPQWRLFFELGEPESFDGTFATFFHGKGEGLITAEVRDGRVVRLDCEPRGPPRVGERGDR